MTQNDPEDVGYDRPGFLTKKDRQWLREQPDGDYSEKRSRIRKRSRSAFRDFSLLFERLPEKDRQMIFEDYDDSLPENPFVDADDGLHENIADMFAFVCLGLADHWPPRTDRDGNHHVDKFETAVWEALRRAYPELGLELWDADIEVESADESAVEAMKENIQRSARTVGSREMRILIDSGAIDLAHLQDFVQEELSEDR